MTLNRPPDVATNAVPTAEAARLRGHRARARVVRLMSVTAVAAATCALWAMPAGAATSAAQAAYLSDEYAAVSSDTESLTVNS